MIKLVVLDVDGTSIDRDNHFYDDDIKEIDFYKKNIFELYGHKIFHAPIYMIFIKSA